MTDMSGSSVSYHQDGKKLAIKVPVVVADTADIIVKVELAEPWNTSAVVPVEHDKGWLSPQPGFGVKQ
jgi:hypothetical protein